MKKAVVILLCVLLSALCACSARTGEASPAAPESAPSAAPAPSAGAPAAPQEAPASSEASSGASAPEAADPAPRLQPGKVFALGDPQAPAFAGGESELATEAELARWQKLIVSGEIARLDAVGMNESGAELSAESAGEILKLLQAAEPSLYMQSANPPTGGSETVFAYAADGSRLFAASFNGEWLSVQFGEEQPVYILNGEGCGLEGLQEYF